MRPAQAGFCGYEKIPPDTLYFEWNSILINRF